MASKRKATCYGRMLRKERGLESEIEALPDRTRDTDAGEDGRFGELFRGTGPPVTYRVLCQWEKGVLPEWFGLPPRTGAPRCHSGLQ